MLDLKLQIRDGFDAESPLLGTFCGSSLPGNITSTSGGLWIEFYSDSSVSSSGFVAYFSAVGEGEFTMYTTRAILFS